MRIDVLGLGSTLLGGKFLGEIMVGVNDVSKYAQPHHLVILDRASSFRNGRLQTIIQTKDVKVITQLHEWERYFSNIQIIKLAPLRSKLEYLDSDTYPYSTNSPFVAVIHAYKLGGTEIVMHGVDFNNHPHLSRDEKFNHLLRDYSALMKALNDRGVRLYVSSAESRLSSVIPVL